MFKEKEVKRSRIKNLHWPVRSWETLNGPVQWNSLMETRVAMDWAMGRSEDDSHTQHNSKAGKKQVNKRD